MEPTAPAAPTVPLTPLGDRRPAPPRSGPTWAKAPHTTEEETVQRIGIIGVGEIGRAIVTGRCDGSGAAPEVFLSPSGEPARP